MITHTVTTTLWSRSAYGSVFTILTWVRGDPFTGAGYLLGDHGRLVEGSAMKGKALRVVLVLAVLGALAAIPASTQVLQASSQTANDRAGGNLPLVVLVNRLELSRAQMETLRTTISELLAQRDVLDQKRAAFEQQMIAFNGTAEELDARLATFNAEMKAARAALQEHVSAAVNTLKETLTMKQGEILTNAFPGLMGHLDAASVQAAGVVPQAMSSGGTMMMRGQIGVMQSSAQASSATTPSATVATAATAVTPQAQTGSMAGMSGGQTGCTMMQSGQASNAQTNEGTSGVVGKIQSVAQRIRDRIAGRLGAATTETSPSTTVSPSAAAANSPCPMMGTMMPSTARADSAQGVASSSEVGSPDDFGTLTVSLSGDAPMPSVSAVGGGQRLVDWLERLVKVLELKLAAMS